MRDVNGKWHECVQARFTADATASIGYRLDYKGGMMNNDFYLQNCGFFADFSPIGKVFKRPKKNKTPQINVTKLPLQ